MRMFLAVDIESGVKSNILVLIEKLKGFEGTIKWVKPNNIHITNYLFGEVSEKDSITLQQLIAKALMAIHPFSVSIKGISGFPSLQRPRVLWVGVENPSKELSVIYNLVDKHLQESSISAYRDSKSYTPHITIGRVKGPFDKKILHEIDEDREQDFGSFQVDNVVLYQSTLMREGPKYSPIKIFEI